MKANELMVGDWVWYNGRNLKVAAIPNEVGMVILSEIGTIGYEVELKDVKPIPITKEVLEKNGFVRLEEKNIYFNLYLALHPMGFSGPYKICDTMMFLEYVHELQHILRLCKIDKEIQV